MKKLMLGFAGEMAAGKGTATKLVKSWHPDTPSFRFSDPLREFWSLWNVHCKEHYGVVFPEKASTPDLQRMSTLIRGLFGENSLERAIVARAERSASKSPIVIIEGIRRSVDISTLMADPQYNFRLVYVEADPNVRWERHRSRNEKPGDAGLSFGRFLELGRAEAEEQIRLLKPRAHLVIDNSGPPEVMERILRAEVAKWLAS